MQDHIPMIGPDSAFYGYIVGLQLERGDLPDSPDIPSRMFARFEYNGTTVWEVPDYLLFRELSLHLCDNARARSMSDAWGRAKLYIERKEGEWIVEIP